VNLGASFGALRGMSAARAVLFDLRGTLIDVSSGWRLSDDERSRFLRSFDGAIRDADIRAGLVEAVAEVNELARRRRKFFDQDRLVLEHAAAKLGLTIPPQRIDAFEEWRNRSFLRALEAYPDAATTLLGLRIVGVPTGCVADGSIRWVRLALERVGLLNLLDVVVASEESAEVKATGAALRLACTRLGLAPPELVFVGDRLDKDVAMARAVGARAVLLDRGGSPHSSARSITSLAEILTWKLETPEETVRCSTPTTS
jgi:putative hydrolase of the HAD superfamily